MTDQDIAFKNNKLTILESIIPNIKPILDAEIHIEIYVDDTLGKDTHLTFNATLEKDLKVSVGDTLHKLRKHDGKN